MGAKTLLLPVCRSGFKAMTDADSEYKDSDKFKLHNRILLNAENYYLSYDGTIEIEL